MINNSVKKEFRLLHRRHNTLQLLEKVNYTYTYYAVLGEVNGDLGEG